MKFAGMYLAILLCFPLQAETNTIALIPDPGIRLIGVDIESVTFKGRQALRVTHRAGEDGGSLAILPGIDFKDGTIEYEFSGDVKPGSPATARGFTGLAFRVQANGSSYECFYQRPLNGRSESQEQRNHSIQYISMPDFPWQRLRKDTPSKYETYADMVPGEWVTVKIEVKGETARLYLNGATQPTLIVNDLKHAVSSGTLALWVDIDSVSHFANLRVTRQ